METMSTMRCVINQVGFERSRFFNVCVVEERKILVRLCRMINRKVVLQTTSPYLFYLKRSDGKSILLKQRHNKMMGDHGTREKIELRYADQC